jgi:hypothetical protein
MLGVVPSGLEANSVGGVNKKRCGQGKVAHEAPSGPDVLPELVRAGSGWLSQGHQDAHLTCDVPALFDAFLLKDAFFTCHNGPIICLTGRCTCCGAGMHSRFQALVPMKHRPYLMVACATQSPRTQQCKSGMVNHQSTTRASSARGCCVG